MISRGSAAYTTSIRLSYAGTGSAATAGAGGRVAAGMLPKYRLTSVNASVGRISPAMAMTALLGT